MLTFSASLLPPIVHHWRRISDIIEPLRYPWHPGFLPAELLFLRHFGEMSHWIPIVLIALFAIAIFKRSARRALITSGALLTAIFSSAYAAYCLIVVSMYLMADTQAIQVHKNTELDGTANRSQPIRPETNQTSGAAGSAR
jgi:hypothetical protein